MKKIILYTIFFCSTILAKTKIQQDFSLCKARCQADAEDNIPADACPQKINQEELNYCIESCEASKCRQTCYKKNKEVCKESKECKAVQKCLDSGNKDCKNLVKACANKCKGRTACLTTCIVD